MYNHNYLEKLVVFCINICKCSGYNPEVVCMHCERGEAGHWFKNRVQKFKLGWGGAPSRWQWNKTWRSTSSRQIQQNYIYMWNSSYRTPNKCWQKTSDFPKDTLRWPTHKDGAKPKAETQELCEHRREREISPSSLRRSGLKLHNQLDVPASAEYVNRQRIIPNSGGGLWKQDILILPLFLFLWVYMCMLLVEILSVYLCFHHLS